MNIFFKHIKDIIFIILLIRLTYVEYNQIYLIGELISSLIYIFVPNYIPTKIDNITDISE